MVECMEYISSNNTNVREFILSLNRYLIDDNSTDTTPNTHK